MRVYRLGRHPVLTERSGRNLLHPGRSILRVGFLDMIRRLFPLMLTALVMATPLSAAGPGTPAGVGDIAPDFTLPDQDGRQHTLSAERGKCAVVLIFYRGHW